MVQVKLGHPKLLHDTMVYVASVAFPWCSTSASTWAPLLPAQLTGLQTSIHRWETTRSRTSWLSLSTNEAHDDVRSKSMPSLVLIVLAKGTHHAPINGFHYHLLSPNARFVVPFAYEFSSDLCFKHPSKQLILPSQAATRSVDILSEGGLLCKSSPPSHCCVVVGAFVSSRTYISWYLQECRKGKVKVEPNGHMGVSSKGGTTTKSCVWKINTKTCKLYGVFCFVPIWCVLCSPLFFCSKPSKFWAKAL